MTRRKNPNTVLREAEIQQVLKGIEFGLYRSARHAKKETGLPHIVISARLRGTRSRNKVHEDQQLFIHAEERENWLSGLLDLHVLIILLVPPWCDTWPNIFVNDASWVSMFKTINKFTMTPLVSNGFLDL